MITKITSPHAQQREMALFLRSLHFLNDDEQLLQMFSPHGKISATNNIILLKIASWYLTFTNKETDSL